MPTVPDLSSIVLILGDIEGQENILELSDNKRFEFVPPKDGQADTTAWRGEHNTVEPKGPFLHLVFELHMFSPDGWIFGSWSDSEICDLQLAENNQGGVSRRHFRIDISPVTHRPRLTNMSRNIILMYDKNLRTVRISPGGNAEIKSPVTLDIGTVRLRAWRPLLSPSQSRKYRKNAEDFHRDYMRALPRTIPHSSADTLPTSDVRFGLLTGEVYRREGVDVGSGTYASVFMVKGIRSGRLYASKVPHFKATDGAGKFRHYWESLRMEFEKVVNLKHTHIVEAVEVLMGRQEIEPPWLIMEWIPRDLRSMYPRDDQIPLLIRQISSGLAFMHAHDVAHRDLKPENILVLDDDSGNVAKIADFGLSKHSPDGRMHTVAGSKAYMAPEIWEQDQSYTNVVDTWSLGVIALELWTELDLSRSSTDSVQEWCSNVVSGIDKAPSDFHPLLHGLLSISPEERWTASKCETWLMTNLESDGPGASSDDDPGRSYRSAHPTLSTTRARSIPSLPTDEEES